ncbi:MAG: hypothetical protein L0387_24335 [Acidobacteria bacterium]|nr:hypothetical protein [Acidobacteriota bacterium]
MGACRVCSRDIREPWNQPLFESARFTVIPSLGSLVEGWVLIVPKQHFLSLAALPDSFAREMTELKKTVCHILSRKCRNLYAFEHGPSKPGLRVGCGVDHAHLHVVPLDFDLSSAMQPFLPASSGWRKAALADCRAAIRDGDAYLYLEEPSGNRLIARHQNFGSQLFRRAIATQLGVPREYDWLDHPQLQNIAGTIRFFEQQVGREPQASDESADAA